MIRATIQQFQEYISKFVSWLTVVEGNPQASSSVATSPRCKVGRHSFLWIASLTLDPYRIMLSAKQGSIKDFESLV